MPGPTLAELITTALTRTGLTYREAEERTGVGYTTIQRLASGRQQATTDDVLKALGKGLRIPVRDLRGAVGRELPPFVLPERAGRLTASERRVIVAMVDALLAARDRQG